MSRSFLKKLIRPVYRKVLRDVRMEIADDPSLTGKFVPYSQGERAFIIEKADNSDSQMAEPGLPAPLLEQNFRHSPGGLETYLSSGKRDYEAMIKILADSGFKIESGQTILDFGCSTARILRWFEDSAKKATIWGVDINSGDITWCKKHLSPPFHFATTTTQPHIPFEDRTFDLIYAGSIFTHVDDLADSWFLELRRVLKPGGMLYATIHDEHTIDMFENKLPDSRTGKFLKADPNYQEYVKRQFTMFTVGRSIGSQVFYNRDWLCESLKSMFEVKSVTEEAYGIFQTALLLQKN